MRLVDRLRAVVAIRRIEYTAPSMTRDEIAMIEEFLDPYNARTRTASPRPEET